MKKKFGLIGYPLKHSLSKAYFDEKFFRDSLVDYCYDLYEIENIQMLEKFIKEEKKVEGLSVAMPYKEQVIDLLDKLDKTAKAIGAVNVIKIKKEKLIGYNTDGDAFVETLEKWFPRSKKSCAIVLGTGGVSKAVQYGLKKLKINFKLVSRKRRDIAMGYEQLHNNSLFTSCNLIINATPVGMFPHVSDFPPVLYDQLTSSHFVYDLIYNPARTLFLQKAEMRGASIKNGIEMLHIQAEKAWKIWNS